MPFGRDTRVVPSNTVLDRGPTSVSDDTGYRRTDHATVTCVAIGLIIEVQLSIYPKIVFA